MKITKITQQVKQPNRYSIFVDGKYAFSLSDTALLESKLTPGRELSEQDVKSFKQKSADDKLYNMALRYAAMRLHSRWEMESYMERKKFPAPLAEIILNKLSTLNFLDDTAFARAWISNRRLLKPSSRRRLQAELRAKRVPDDIIQAALREDETDERTLLKELIAKKRKQARYRDDQKLMQHLARQGFSYDDIKQSLQNE